MTLHRRALAVLAALIAAVTLAACGSSSHSTSSSTTPAPVEPPSTALRHCDPALGKGVMGACLTPAPKASRAPTTAAGARLIPDVSEFQGCALHSEAIFRIYEAGTERQDARALCHAEEVHRLHVWAAVYAFLRPGHGGCVFQADRTLAILQRIGGVVGPVVADAEVTLSPGFVRCFLNRVKARGDNAVEYTCPGCGDEQVHPIWIASYPTRPAGTWVAHQFSDRFPCRGVVGDCSVNEGILSIRQESDSARRAKARRELAAHKALLAQLEKQHAHLRTKLQKFGCSRRRHEHQRLGPRCRGWFGAGDRVVQHIAVERREIARLR